MPAASGLLEIAALLVGGAFALAALCARLGIPTLVGHLLAGVVIGPAGLGLIERGEALAAIGEIGVILLMFALGLEFSLPRFLSLRRLILGLGAAQMALTTFLLAPAVAAAAGLGALPAILVAGAAAMSSTALTLKILAGKGTLGAPHGRAVIAVLLFQDLAAVALLVLHDAAAGGGGHGRSLATLALGLGALTVALLVGRRPLQRLADWIARHGEPERAQLLALGIALVAAVAAIAGGLSPALGAFAAGMMISEGDARNVVEREIRPFRDLLVGLFFIGIGTQLQLRLLPDFWPEVALWLAVLLAGKMALVWPLARGFGEAPGVAWRVAAILANGGEFGLMLASVARVSGVIPQPVADPLLLALGISLLAGGLIVRRAG
ncbi:MAG: hypothetical protein KatS3mg118_2662 [Paracoccaceae bacterium]|nr:MAG: hypothetical protein KatS3mg118_2662 [Paracoccaceae bacterium]